MNPEEILAEIQAMQAEGLINENDANILAAENSDYPNMFALRMAVESSFDFQEAEESMEIAEHPVRNFIGAAAQGATFGFADELVGLANEDLGESMGRAQEIRRERAPGATALSEIAGALALPGIPGAAAGRVAPGATRGALRGAARGGLFGTASGAAAGAGFADEGERLQGAATGAAFGGVGGAVLGAPAGAIGGLFGSAAGRGGRIADSMLELSGNPSLDLLSAKGAVAVEKARIQQTLYQPLSAANESVSDPAIMGFLRNTSTNLNLKSLIPRQFRAGSTGIRSGPGRRTGVLIRGAAAEPSFEDLQTIRQSLRNRAYDQAGDINDREALAAADELTELMQDAMGPELAAADAAWSAASANERAIDKGWTMFNDLSPKVEETRNALTPAQREAFDQGRLSRISAELRVRNKGAVGLLQQYLDAGTDTRAQVGSLFPGGVNGTAFAQLENMLASEASTARIADFFNSVVTSGAIGATGGAISGGLISRGANN